MLYLFLSVCCSVTVSVMLKLARRYHIDVLQAITWNYSVAIALTWFIFKPHLQVQQTNHGYEYLLLGVLLPVLFIIIARAVDSAGIVRTDVAQRLSLLIPILAAFFWYGEVLTRMKFIGIVVGIIAMLFAIPLTQKSAPRNAKGSWVFLLLVLAGFGFIDVLFKQIALFKDVPYTTSLFIVFILAFIVALLFVFIQIYRRKTKFSWPHILIGWVLGAANFGNILFYIKAHQALAKNPSTVFAAMNIGVVVVATLVGIIGFKEKLTTLNKVGIALAVSAIVIIANA